MDRDTFLTELRVALHQGGVSQAKVNETLQYYERYIMEESRKGKTEEQVLEELGNPRLIAKTIITMDGDHSQQQSYQETDETYTDGEDSHRTYPRGLHVNFDERNGWDVRIGRFKLNSWYGTICIIILVVAILVVLAQVAIMVIPIILPILIVGIILYLIFGNKK